MTDTTTENSEPNQPLGLALTDLLGRAPWADDVEAWLEASSAEEIADDIDRYTMAEVARAVAAERERWRTAAEYAAHQLEKARIWGGMEWHYNPLHPMHYRSALERLRDVLRA